MAQTYKHEEIEHNDNDDNDDDDDIFFLLNGIQKDADSRHTPQYTSNSRSFPEANRDGKLHSEILVLFTSCLYII